ISARAHSHSVQSMERYHEEYHRLRDRDQAIIKSYTEIYAPAMVSILADGLAILTLLVARIPIIWKLAILCSFWIISIFISVVTLHPIILSFTPPPAEEHVSGRTPLERFMSWMMAVALVALLSFGLYFQHLLKVGDTTPGAALLYPKHPYNIAFSKVNEKFLGASQLVIIAEGNAYCTVKGEACEGADCRRCFPEQEGQCGAEKCVQREGAIENAATLNELDLFARYMAERPEVGGTVTAT